MNKDSDKATTRGILQIVLWYICKGAYSILSVAQGIGLVLVVITCGYTLFTGDVLTPARNLPKLPYTMWMFSMCWLLVTTVLSRVLNKFVLNRCDIKTSMCAMTVTPVVAPLPCVPDLPCTESYQVVKIERKIKDELGVLGVSLQHFTEAQANMFYRILVKFDKMYPCVLRELGYFGGFDAWKGIAEDINRQMPDSVFSKKRREAVVSESVSRLERTRGDYLTSTGAIGYRGCEKGFPWSGFVAYGGSGNERVRNALVLGYSTMHMCSDDRQYRACIHPHMQMSTTLDGEELRICVGLTNTLWHELGHLLIGVSGYKYTMPYHTLYKKARKAGKIRTEITKYAETNADEYMADSFSVYTQGYTTELITESMQHLDAHYLGWMKETHPEVDLSLSRQYTVDTQWQTPKQRNTDCDVLVLSSL